MVDNILIIIHFTTLNLVTPILVSFERNYLTRTPNDTKIGVLDLGHTYNNQVKLKLRLLLT